MPPTLARTTTKTLVSGFLNLWDVPETLNPKPSTGATATRYSEQHAEEAAPTLGASESSMVERAIAGFEFQAGLGFWVGFRL